MYEHNPTINYQNYLSSDLLKNICSENFPQFIIKASTAEFIFSKVKCFQHILLNAYSRVHLKHENYSLRGILF